MRHPFDGIIPAKDADSAEVQPSRREVLGWMLAAPAAGLLAGSAMAQPPKPAEIFRGGRPDGAAAEDPGVAVDGAKVVGRHIYFVVPKDYRTFNIRRRQELGINGPNMPGLAGDDLLAKSKGYFAWLTKEQADKAREHEEVQAVEQITPAKVIVQGTPPKEGTATLRIYAVPFGWPVAPEKGTFLPMEELGKELDRAVTAQGAKANVIANGELRQPYVQFADAANIPAAAVDALKSNPQIYMLQWMTPVVESTRRLGEEGGGATTERVDEEGGVTTFALGEEGGPTTRAVGEEGGPTTEAFGEEGGATTMAIGEEGGGVTTQALGEEGGGISTRARGEEGGGVSTRALGEEGGRPPMPSP